ncbi:IS200/IS605 family element RNA-guided endonuclease TnpB [Limnoraphis robusta Tam1]|uniref:IS200/IS605 family element RNA-guided endonuclease TnpB n=1 Tax=Limnoraphis robusta CCNP1315 TaxID=3110306 RepID=A0ABU5TYM6_9CYAN|nr:IS200/IS605 family element RNA-guided endonuclease TnpB [Limnoraphis robusta]MEA5500209.1 IS200/IS605 family element RNA-guided endonuclease TnpB [Limnoraphis robusta BA-68 BA1]MEA5519895.1 IS200/IS605 family element RNA-guided endonuclease TnpB [Limnoraphis robusta CCNP1315]MEA5539677.1 IS200/IS605 family element RNA-guided endonuclease TnpB [Limnoraphis robusta Tam1]MEA5547802.1 IS200/IS605 family element RNA-guided endonuclease TnpB [Limnoraphis robusta CCNP1324]
MFTALKVRLYPNQEQRIQLLKEFGCARFVYNRFLAEWNKVYEETGKGLNYTKCANKLPALKKELPWLTEVASQVLQQSLKNLDTAFKNFFTGTSRYPKLKSKHRKQSATYPQGFRVNSSTIKLPKLGEVKAKIHRSIKGKVKSITVSMTPSGKYFASLKIELAGLLPKPCIEGKVIGVDLGLDALIVTSDGEKIKPPKFYRQYEKKLARSQKRLSRKVKGSSNRNKARIKVAKVHNKIANCRLDAHHKLSRKLVDKNQVIVFENLNIKGMGRNHCLAKSINDAAWGMLQTLTEYKAKEQGKLVVFVDRFFPSSKTCNCCGHRIDTMPLKVRTWECPKCGKVHDRDINTALNLRDYFITETVAEKRIKLSLKHKDIGC